MYAQGCEIYALFSSEEYQIHYYYYYYEISPSVFLFQITSKCPPVPPASLYASSRGFLGCCVKNCLLFLTLEFVLICFACWPLDQYSGSPLFLECFPSLILHFRDNRIMATHKNCTEVPKAAGHSICLTLKKRQNLFHCDRYM